MSVIIVVGDGFFWQGKMQEKPAEEAGEERADKYAELGIVKNLRHVGVASAEREVGDEERYSEADSTEHGD